MKFYVGTHIPHWLRKTAHELFVSRRRLAMSRSPGPASGRWALDSGGFSELNLYGGWRTEPARYADEASRWQAEVGNLDWAAIQDWMCEPFMLAKTGKSLAEHQALTVESYGQLRELAPGVPWAPVLQGWRIDDYLAHAEQYAAAGFDLKAAPVVGVGSVCKRQATREAVDLFHALRPLGLRLHGFGLKVGAIKGGFAAGLASMDSMAWSYSARKRGGPLPGCVGHKSCANCFRYAMRWRDEVLRVGRRPVQMVMIL